MTIRTNNLRLIFGLKVKHLRHQKNLGLKDLSALTGLSVSYLSEIEQGKKYPSPEKIIALAGALGMSFDDLVKANDIEDSNPISSFMNSPIIKEFPFQLFGITLGDVVGLVRDSPAKASAFVRTLSEIGEMYDMRVEQFFFAALRSYQKMHHNYFSDIEDAAIEFLAAHRWKQPPSYAQLCAVLRDEHAYEIDEKTLQVHPELKALRSIWIPGLPQRLYINGLMMASQKAFVAGHALAYEFLKLSDRPATSTWIKVESFDGVLNNFKASYFAGALLIHRDALRNELARFFKKTKWDGREFVDIMSRFQATPEMFLYRLTQIIPEFFNMEEIYFLRFNNESGTSNFHITKELNTSRFFVPHGIGLNEHYCRRWLSIRLLQELGEKGKKKNRQNVLVAAQRSRFIDSEAEFLTISLARRLVLTEKSNSCVTIGFLVNDQFRNTVRFWKDPAIPVVEVNETCERCRLTQKECKERACAATLYEHERTLEKREGALHRLIASTDGREKI